MRLRHVGIIITLVLGMASLAVLTLPYSNAYGDTLSQGMMPTIGLLTPPPTVFPPTQADDGAQIYFYRCLVCHGDRGQGLTEWRKELDPPDNNCWQSKCHAPNHLEGSFTFPHDVPPVIGPGVLRQFGDAQRLRDFLQKNMPFQEPGGLKDAEYWDLTAFLMRENGVQPPQTLGISNAANFKFTPPVTPLKSSSSYQFYYLGAAILLMVLLGFVGLFFYRRRSF